MKRIKLVIITLMSVCILFVGVHINPMQNNANALVYEILEDLLKSMPAYLFDENSFSKPRKIKINGNTTYMMVGKTQDTISNVLNFYEDQYPNQKIQKLQTIIHEQIKDQKTKQKDIEILTCLSSYLDEMKKQAHFRSETDKWGFLGIFEMSENIDFSTYERRIERNSKSIQKINDGKIGTAKIVIAIRSDEELTKIITIWTDSEFNILKFLNEGNDIPGIPRYSNFKRLISIEQENSQTIDRLITYKGGASIQNIIHFYQSTMKEKGWFFKSDNHMLKKKNETLLNFFQKNRECSILIEKNKHAFVTTIIDRTKRT